MHRTIVSSALVILILILLVYYNTNDGFVNVSRYGQIFKQTSYSRLTHPRIKGNFNRTLPKPILIMTYMRSGSTFLGDVIQASPDVFYVFEPLWSIEVFRTPLKDLQGNNIDGSLDEIALQITRDVFSCHIKKLPIKMLYHEHFMGVSRSTAEMNMCRTNLTYMLSCAEALQRKCINSKFVLIKSIRIRAYQLLDIKEDFPDLKVVYLIRDPRAVLASQMNYGMATFRHLNESEFVSEFCMNVTQDTQVVRVFQKFYPGDINVVYHNSFEQNGVAYSRDIYRALGITFNTESKRTILSLTGDGENCTRSYALCTRKYNSTVEIGKWRTEISFHFARLVDFLCKSVYKSHGFISFDSTKMLQNLSYPSHDTSLSTFKHRRLS